jgi:hypothetical protein
MGVKTDRMHAYRKHLEGKKDYDSAKDTLARICTHVGDMFDRITNALPGLGGSFVDSPLTPGTGAILPQPCRFTVRIVGGLADIEITLPQFYKASTPKLQQLQIVDNPNALLAGIIHNLQSCSDASFSVAAGLKDYQPTSQVHITKIDGNTFWRIRSSYDGKNYNDFSAVQRST